MGRMGSHRIQKYPWLRILVLPLIFQLKARNESSTRLTDCTSLHPCPTFTHVPWLSHQSLPTPLPSLVQAWPLDVVCREAGVGCVTSGRSFKGQDAAGLFSLPPRDISETGDKGQRGSKSQPTCDQHGGEREKQTGASLWGSWRPFTSVQCGLPRLTEV